MKKLIDDMNEKFRENLKYSLNAENIRNLQVKVLLGSVIFTMYNNNKISPSEWTEAMDYINNLNE